MNRKSAIFALLILSSLLATSAVNTTVNVNGASAIANLVFKTNGGGVRPDYGLYIAQYLRALGIEVEVKIEEWSVFVGTLLLTHDYDIGIVGLSGGGSSPDMRDCYTGDGSLNLFLLGPDLPYGNKKSSKNFHTQSFFTTINYHNENEIKQNLMKIFPFFYF